MRRALAVIAVAGAATLAACGSSSSPALPTTAQAQTSSPGTVGTTGTVAGGLQAPPLPTKPGPIPAGRYETGTFRPALVFELPDGFRLQSPESADWLSLQSTAGSISILDFPAVQVIDPAGLSGGTLNLLNAPADVAAWLEQHPSLAVSASTDVRVAGAVAKQLDVRAKAGLDQVPLFYPDETLLVQPKGWVARAIVLEVAGGQVEIGILAPESGFAAFVTRASRIVSSLSIDAAASRANAPATAGGACSDVQTFRSVGRNHVEQPPPDSTYNSFPPTSGPHYPAPAKWGVYDKPIPQFVLVHNLEHGGIVIQYGSQVSPGFLRGIIGWVAGDPDGMLVAPLPALGDKIAVTAWTHLLTCNQFDENAFTAFRGAYRYKGPELLSASSYKPAAAA